MKSEKDGLVKVKAEFIGLKMDNEALGKLIFRTRTTEGKPISEIIAMVQNYIILSIEGKIKLTGVFDGINKFDSETIKLKGPDGKVCGEQVTWYAIWEVETYMFNEENKLQIDEIGKLIMLAGCEFEMTVEKGKGKSYEKKEI